MTFAKCSKKKLHIIVQKAHKIKQETLFIKGKTAIYFFLNLYQKSPFK